MKSNIRGNIFGNRVEQIGRADHKPGECQVSHWLPWFLDKPLNRTVCADRDDSTSSWIWNFIHAKCRHRFELPMQSRHASKVSPIQNVRVEHPRTLVCPIKESAGWIDSQSLR